MHKWYVHKIMPGYVVVHSGIQAGAPTVPGTRIPTESLGGCYRAGDSIEAVHHAWDYITREQVIAAIAFDAGVAWQRSRKQRKDVEAEIHASWASYAASHPTR